MKTSKTLVSWTLVGMASLFLLGCGRPVLTSLSPSSGPPGTVVEVNGSKLLTASVQWDYGRPTEQTLPSNFLSARFFTVPMGPTVGPHPVRLKKGSQVSANEEMFTVTNDFMRPEPRLDDLTVSFFRIQGGGQADFILMAHGANIDVGATIVVNGTDQPTAFSKLLRNPNPQASDPSTLGYAILHYGTVWAFMDNQSAGTDIQVKVRNLDGNESNTLTYRIAGNMDALDSDGDGLPDDWEENGYDADGDGTIDVDLPALGANPLRKDIFVEVDWISGSAPNTAIWTTIEDAFDNAPILNPDGSTGISIHIDRGQAGAGGGGGDAISFVRYVYFPHWGLDPSLDEDDDDVSSFYDLKSANFNSDRRDIYQYCIFAFMHGNGPGSSGIAEDFMANDFIVSLGSWTNGNSANLQVGTFIHELGHNLGLRHGGDENANRKPPYNSIMRYGDPGQFPGVDSDCDNLGDNIYTYSQGMRASLNENSLNEGAGVCDGIDIDWNGNGSIQSGVATDINSDGSRSTLRDYADWANIRLDFRSGTGWRSN